MVLSFSTSMAGGIYEIKGKVTGIEKGFATIKSSSGETKVAMKNLSKKQKKEVQEAQGRNKEISLQLLPVALKKE